MGVIDELLAAQGMRPSKNSIPLQARPARRLAVVTCMDCRVDVLAALGLEHGEAHVLRNASGVVSDDMIRSLAISQRRLGTEEIAIIHHTDCGMQTISDDGFRAELQEATGMAPPFAIESFSDVDADVRHRCSVSGTHPSCYIAIVCAASSTSSTAAAFARFRPTWALRTRDGPFPRRTT